MGLALFTRASESGAAWQLVSAATMLVLLPVLLLFLIFQRQFITGYAHSGLKQDATRQPETIHVSFG